MKMLVRQTPVGSELPFVLDLLKGHIRADPSDTSEDVEITNLGLAAAAEIEQVSQIALLEKTVRVTVFEASMGELWRLPIGPAKDTATPTVTINGQPFSDYTFFGGNRPHLKWGNSFANLSLSWVQIEYQAGFGDTASSIPADLSYALMDQAALLYDARSPLSTKSLTHSPHMARIGAKYRGVSL
ncbi:hypothetical protein [Epibacterium sp. Ofav1-8]|uniref:hypothetical protein n=1 Tax=Epibacterium sp. Ofav1-8 TaxID=2917735 RepID=UPI001EF4BD4B|nr:hypothetical protein [Epibacterium sp. Ofav1-8]MCG7623010.1 hypothetical protein [Epibacterium sp. Ofav1-8]